MKKKTRQYGLFSVRHGTGVATQLGTSDTHERIRRLKRAHEPDAHKRFRHLEIRETNPRNTISSEHAALRRMIRDPKTSVKGLKGALTRHLKHEGNPLKQRWQIYSYDSGGNRRVMFTGSKNAAYAYWRELPRQVKAHHSITRVDDEPSQFEKMLRSSNPLTSHAVRNMTIAEWQKEYAELEEAYKEAERKEQWGRADRLGDKLAFMEMNAPDERGENPSGRKRTRSRSRHKSLGSRARASASPGTSAFPGGRNPVPQGSRAKLEAATKRYELFRDQDSEHVIECESNLNGKPIGKMLAILYTTVRAGKTERYKHDFKKECAPTVIKLGDHHGAPRIRTQGGKFEFTDRGFVDYPSRGSNPSKPDYSTCTEVGKLDGFELLKSDGKIYEVSWPAKERMTLAVSSDGRAIISLLK